MVNERVLSPCPILRFQQLPTNSSPFHTSGQVLPQEARCQDKTILTSLWKFLLIARFLIPEGIFMLHGHTSMKSSLQQDRDKLRPVDQSLPRNPIAPPTVSVNSNL